MHGIDNPMKKFLENTEAHNPPVNYGGAVDHYQHRKILGVGIQKTSQEERRALLEHAETDLQAGAIGIHQQPEYTVDLQKSEIVDHGHLAMKYNVPLCLHLRHSYDKDFGSQESAINEALEVARETGCSIHIEHLNSTGGTGRMRDAIAQIQNARDEGLAITACIYPYTFWATNAGSARFDNFQEKYDISFEDLQEAGKPDRMTEETFSIARKDNKLVAAYAMSEEDITEALSAPWVLIGSDAILERPHNNHPRSAGCFSRLLSNYVRKQKILSLSDALAKITILPAQLLEKSSSSMKLRGRIQSGAIADITMFDPEKISDRADVSNPAQESVGIVHVMVGGQLARNNNKNNNVQSGVPILRDIS
jgi:N-acyl-D-aspartate/D-glutamate deacylase